MTREIEDPVFGHLRYETFWEGRTATPLLGDSVRISIDTMVDSFPDDSRCPSDAQRNAFLLYLKHEGRFRPAIEGAMCQLYQEARNNSHLWLSEAQIDQQFPTIEKASEVWQFYARPSLMIPRQLTDDWKVIQSWHVPWRDLPVEIVVGNHGIEGFYDVGEHGLY